MDCGRIALLLCIFMAREIVLSDSANAPNQRTNARKRSRDSGGMSAFRPDTPVVQPIDPLFTDQREIRLPFAKVFHFFFKYD